MSHTYRRPCSGYQLREHRPLARVARAVPACHRAVREYRFSLLLLALLAFGWTDSGAEVRIAQDQRTAMQVERDDLARYHRENWVRATLEGPAPRVANMALQLAAVLR